MTDDTIKRMAQRIAQSLVPTIETQLRAALAEVLGFENALGNPPGIEKHLVQPEPQFIKSALLRSSRPAKKTSAKPAKRATAGIREKDIDQAALLKIIREAGKPGIRAEDLLPKLELPASAARTLSRVLRKAFGQKKISKRGGGRFTFYVAAGR